MVRAKFKQKCGICKLEWVTIRYREYPICIKCHMKQIFSEEIKDKKYKFLDLDRKTYEKSKFLRNIRRAYLMYKELTEKQIEAFKEAVKTVKNSPPEEN